MKKVAIEMSKSLRQAFKIACSMNNITMKNALIQEVRLILDNDKACYQTSRPELEEEMCVLCLNVEQDFIDDVKARKQIQGDKIRNIYITAIINYLLDHNSNYDYSQDIDEV